MAKTLAGLALKAFWGAKFNGWDGDMDTNLQKLSAVAQLSVLSQVTYPPSTPVAGAIYIVPGASGTNPNSIAVVDSDAITYAYVTPIDGMRAFVRDERREVRWNAISSIWEYMNTGPAGRKSVNDAAYTMAATDRQVAYIGIAAARIVTLPAASAVPAGTEIQLVDETGSLTNAITLTLQRAGTDTINGIATHVLAAPFSHIKVESDGVSKWTISEFGDNDGTWTFYTPTVSSLTGTITTASATGYFKKVGKTVHVKITIFVTTIGTGAYPQASLPFPAASTGGGCTGAGRENGGTGMFTVAIGPSSNVATIYKYENSNPGVSGGTYPFSITYEAA